MRFVADGMKLLMGLSRGRLGLDVGVWMEEAFLGVGGFFRWIWGVRVLAGDWMCGCHY